MENQSCVPYRGYTIDVRVVASQSPSLDGQQVRYAVSWTIASFDSGASPVISLPEQLNFLTLDNGFRYAERQAKRFIDGCANDGSAGAAPV
ncbi:hypothetical protein AWB72_03878 [Caballeronia concitans]|jgi:hypothetical protein|uniref:Lipoprotein n=1 Tax=Caballeronia concitans TaxID=1777133 RepID=A0A658R0P6_9BURK|nr:hypothetical protein AWB72_03878 [Caballeronia concitans]